MELLDELDELNELAAIFLSDAVMPSDCMFSSSDPLSNMTMSLSRTGVVGITDRGRLPSPTRRELNGKAATGSGDSDGSFSLQSSSPSMSSSTFEACA